MSVLSLDANSIFPKAIRIGYEGENVVTQIDFNLKMWVAKYGLGGVTLLVLRHGDRDAYPVPLMIEDGVASWLITKTDTAKVGRGAIQLKYVVGEKVKKSPIFDVICLNALDDSDTVPDPYDSWLATLTDLSALTTANAQAAAQSAAQAAESAQASASASAQSATASANSASQASGYAQSASASAQSASGYASSAETSAHAASAKASEASASASTASQKASESAQSASQALTYKNDAESAKTASQTAQGLAESARDTAVSAKEDAEDARDEAQSIVDGISAKAEQIDSNTERIESLEDDRYKPYAVDSASGSIASFVDGADDIPLKSLVVDINPVQDLHGYDSPWPAGGGKNLLPIDSVFHDDNTGNVIIFNGSITGVYTLSIDTSGVTSSVSPNAAVCSVTVDGTVECNVSLNNKEHTYNGTITRIYVFAANSYTQYRGTVKFQLELGSIATSWSPYSNICPISGWTEVNVNHSDADMTNPTTITIDLGQTVYGGKLDVLSGVLTVDRAQIASYAGETLPSTWISDRDVYSDGATPTTGAQVCYYLASPITYTLTPQEITSLLGTNNLWADTGNSEVEYRADTKLYVDNKITQAIAAALNS